MADAVQQLQAAFEYIENGNLQAAQEVLDAIRPQNENNPDFWWVYAHAVADENMGRDALSRVRQLAPNYPGLQELETQAGMQPSRIRSLRSLGTPPPPSPPMEESLDTKPKRRLRNWVLSIGGFVVLIAVIAAILYVSGILGGGGTPAQPTTVVNQTTPLIEPSQETTAAAAAASEDVSEAAPTATTEVPTLVTSEVSETAPIATTEAPTRVPTEVPITPSEAPATVTETPLVPTEASAGDPFVNLYPALEAFAVPDDGITSGQTSMGASYIVTICGSPGPVVNTNILGIMNVFVDANLTLPDDLEAVAFSITDCTTNTVALTLGIQSSTAAAYLAGDLSDSELLQALRRAG